MTKSSYDDMPIPIYIASISDVSGCDSSGNVIDLSNNLIDSNPCNLLQSYDCSSKACAYSWWKILILVAGVVLGLLLIGLIIWGISKAVSSPSSQKPSK